MNWKKKFMWAASFLVSLFVCGTALAAGNDASADTPAPEHQSGHAAEQILSDRHLLSLPICGKPRQCRGNFLTKT